MGILAVVIITANRTARYLLATVGMPEVLSHIVHIAIILLAGWFTLCRLHRWGAAAELREKLLEQGVPACRKCGYSQRGLPPTTTRCPECGADHDERVVRLLTEVR